VKNNQIAVVDGRAFTEQDMFSAIDSVVDELESTGDIQKATSALVALEKLENVSGHAKARLLYGMWLWWLENNSEKPFADYIESRGSETKKVTVDRYITVQHRIGTGEIPEDVAKLPMRSLVPIAKTLSHGYKITRSQFDKIIKANNSREIEDILRGIKNKEPRKSAMTIQWERDGTLNAWKDNKKSFLGWLDKEAYASNELAQKAINRILDNTGIMRK